MSEFHFIRPLWLLALIPLALLLWRMRHVGGGEGAWRGVCDPHLLEALMVGEGRGDGGRLLRALLAVGWLLAVVALAGPAWERLPQPLYKEGGARVILLDLSRSMDAGDLKPSRLSRARYKLLDILERSREGQTALIAFAAEPFVVAPLTDDVETIANLVRPLSTALMPTQGSRPELALERGAELLRQAGVAGGELLLIGDGVNEVAIEAAERLRADGRRVSVLAVGSAGGAPIPLKSGGFLKDGSGAIVLPKLEEAGLRQLALGGGGHYRRLTADDSDLRGLLADAPEGEARRSGEATGEGWREEGPWLVLALLPLALLGFRRGWLGALLLVTLAPPPTHAFEWADLWQRPDQRAAKQFESAPAEAAERFRDPDWRASAHYRAGNYDGALEGWSGSDAPDAHYNRGNALAHQGKLKEALEAYDAALEGDPQMVDAKANRELIEKLLQQQQPPQQGQQGGESQDQRQGESEQQPQPGESGRQGEQGESSPEASPSDGESSEESGQAEPGDGRESDEAQGQPPEPQSEPQAGEEGEPRPTEPRAGEEMENETGEGEADGRAQPSEETLESSSEEKMRVEQWLRRVPDDPGGLLRQKFLLEHRRRGAAGENGSESAKQW